MQHQRHVVGSGIPGLSWPGLCRTARTLAFQLATQPDVDAALAAYEAERRPATARLVLANRGEGPERVMQLAEDRAPAGFVNVTDVIGRDELESAADSYKKIAGFDREALNTRPSLTPTPASA